MEGFWPHAAVKGQCSKWIVLKAVINMLNRHRCALTMGFNKLTKCPNLIQRCVLRCMTRSPIFLLPAPICVLLFHRWWLNVWRKSAESRTHMNGFMQRPVCICNCITLLLAIWQRFVPQILHSFGPQHQDTHSTSQCHIYFYGIAADLNPPCHSH